MSPERKRRSRGMARCPVVQKWRSRCGLGGRAAKALAAAEGRQPADARPSCSSITNDAESSVLPVRLMNALHSRIGSLHTIGEDAKYASQHVEALHSECERPLCGRLRRTHWLRLRLRSAITALLRSCCRTLL